MVDVDRHIAYWREGAQEDWAVAGDLLARGRIRHGLFFAHLALEKALKAHACRHTRDLAPRTHNLVRLVEVAAVQLSSEHLATLAEMNAFSQAGRYPETLSAAPTAAEADGYLTRATEVFEWLMSRL